MTNADARDLFAACLSEIAPEVDLAAVDGHAPLGAELELDSMDLLGLLAALEDRTGRPIPDGAIRPEWGVDEVVAYLAAADDA